MMLLLLASLLLFTCCAMQDIRNATTSMVAGLNNFSALPALNYNICNETARIVQIDYHKFEWFITERIFANQKKFARSQYNKLQIEHVHVHNESIPIYHTHISQRGVRLQFEGTKNATIQYRVAPTRQAFASVSKLWRLLLEPWELDTFFFRVSMRSEQLPAVICVPTIILSTHFSWTSNKNATIQITRNDSQWVCVKHSGCSTSSEDFVLNYSVSLMRMLQVCPWMLIIDKMLSPMIVTFVAIFLVFLGCYNLSSMIDEYRFYKKVALYTPQESDDDDDDDDSDVENNANDLLEN